MECCAVRCAARVLDSRRPHFVTLVVFGMFIVMNLFLAILLANFTGLTNGHEEEEQAPKLELVHCKSWESREEAEKRETHLEVGDDLESGLEKLARSWPEVAVIRKMKETRR